jgi:hypothetical protein
MPPRITRSSMLAMVRFELSRAGKAPADSGWVASGCWWLKIQVTPSASRGSMRWASRSTDGDCTSRLRYEWMEPESE